MSGSIIIQNPFLLGDPLMQGQLKRSFHLMDQLANEGFTVLRLEINGCTAPVITVRPNHRCEFLVRDGQAVPVKEKEGDFGRWVAYQMSCQGCCITWETCP